MSADIEFAEIKWNDGDGNDYLNIYSEGRTHSFLLEDVLEKMQEPAEAEQLRARLARAERIEQAAIHLMNKHRLDENGVWDDDYPAYDVINEHERDIALDELSSALAGKGEG